jgi:hypothetical protein
MMCDLARPHIIHYFCLNALPITQAKTITNPKIAKTMGRYTDQHIPLATSFKALPQRPMTSIDRITRYPLGRESRVQGTPQHACSQFCFGGKDHLFWDIGCSRALRVLGRYNSRSTRV